MSEPTHWYGWIQIAALIGGLFGGTYAIYSACWFIFKRHAITTSSGCFALLGAVIIGLVIWHSTSLQRTRFPAQFSQLVTTVDSVATRVDNFESRFADLITHTEQLQARLAEVSAQQASDRAPLRHPEAQLRASLEEVQSSMQERITSVETLGRNVGTQVAQLAQRLAQLWSHNDNRLAAYQDKLSKMKATVQTMRTSVDKQFVQQTDNLHAMSAQLHGFSKELERLGYSSWRHNGATGNTNPYNGAFLPQELNLVKSAVQQSLFSIQREVDGIKDELRFLSMRPRDR